MKGLKGVLFLSGTAWSVGIVGIACDYGFEGQMD